MARTLAEFLLYGERATTRALLGKTDDLGVIEAVFYKSARRIPAPMSSAPQPFAVEVLGDPALGTGPSSRSEAENRRPRPLGRFCRDGDGAPRLARGLRSVSR